MTYQKLWNAVKQSLPAWVDCEVLKTYAIVHDLADDAARHEDALKEYALALPLLIHTLLLLLTIPVSVQHAEAFPGAATSGPARGMSPRDDQWTAP